MSWSARVTSILNLVRPDRAVPTAGRVGSTFGLSAPNPAAAAPSGANRRLAGYFRAVAGAIICNVRGSLDEFAGFEFAIATLNSFPPIEQELRRINRYADILLFTQPGSICSWHSELMEFLARSSPNLVVANRYALSGLSEFGVSEREFVARHDKRLLLVHSDGSPLPSTPLHFENGPSVSLLMPLLLFARPRRIFLFGADGGSNPSFSKRPYLYHDDYDADVEPQEFLNRPGIVSFKELPHKLDEHNRRQHINAINADRVIEFAFRSLQANFGNCPARC